MVVRRSIATSMLLGLGDEAGGGRSNGGLLVELRGTGETERRSSLTLAVNKVIR